MNLQQIGIMIEPIQEDPVAFAEKLIDLFPSAIYEDIEINQHMRNHSEGRSTVDCRLYIALLASFLSASDIKYSIIIKTDPNGSTHPKILLEDGKCIDFVKSTDQRHPLVVRYGNLENTKVKEFSFISSGSLESDIFIIDSVFKIKSILLKRERTSIELALARELIIKIYQLDGNFANSRFIEELCNVLYSY